MFIYLIIRSLFFLFYRQTRILDRLFSVPDLLLPRDQQTRFSRLLVFSALAICFVLAASGPSVFVRIDRAPWINAATAARYLPVSRCLFISANIFIGQIPNDKNISPRGFFHRVHRAQTRVCSCIAAHEATHARVMRNWARKYLTLPFARELLSFHPGMRTHIYFFSSRLLRPAAERFPQFIFVANEPVRRTRHPHCASERALIRALQHVHEFLDGAASPRRIRRKIAISPGENESMRRLVIRRYL